MQSIVPLKCIGKVRYRPLGTSNLKPAPWAQKEDEDEYVPTVMSEEALVLGVDKSLETQEDWPEDCVQMAMSYIVKELRSVWTSTPEDMVISEEEAIAQFTLEKSPGFPYYYKHSTKEDVLLDDSSREEMIMRSRNLMEGLQEDSFCSLTEKSELRPIEKVRLKKTRIFAACTMHHLLACTRLYGLQNQMLMAKRDNHPITIGIQMPGPEYVQAMTSFRDGGHDADLSGCDQRFPLRLARAIRDIRHQFLPDRFLEAGYNIYDAVYAGVVVVLGKAYVMYGNKSGWHNTGHDNSLMSWLALVIANLAVYNRVPRDTFYCKLNGDDWLYRQLYGCFRQIVAWLKPRGVVVETDFELKNPLSLVYLSHHLEKRYVSGFGDFLVASGNLAKLKSSLNWIKPSKTLTLEESCVAHLVGLRMCMFPYPDEFERTDEILTNYLRTVVPTEFIKSCLSARFTEYELAVLHTRVESFSQQQLERQVLKFFKQSLFKFNNYEAPTIKKTTTEKGKICASSSSPSSPGEACKGRV